MKTLYTRDEVTPFWRGPASNWHLRDFTVGNTRYNCVEQWMMARKAREFGDRAAYDKIMAATSPKDQKALGREVAGYDDAHWQAMNETVVFVGALHKFAQHADLRQWLLATGKTLLIEASPVDTTWGVGLAESDDRILDVTQWRGTNKQGRVLTRARTVLQVCERQRQTS